MPPTALFDGAHRPDGIVVPSCIDCNKGTSTADLVVSLASRWGDAQYSDDHAKLASRLKKQAPEIVEEWTSLSLKDRIKGKRHLRAHGVVLPDNCSVIGIGEHTIRQLNLFAHKAVLALYFHHYRRPLPATGAFCAMWRTKEDYASGGLPKPLLDMMPGYQALTQGNWSTADVFEYRYATGNALGLLAFFARFRFGFFVAGFTADDAASVMERDDASDWLQPCDLLTLLDTPRFLEKV
jgi:hypothetical protein